MRILLVTADTDLAEISAYALRRAGHKVLCAASVSQALTAWDTEPTDLVIVDSVLPDAGSTTLCARIRQRSHTPILLVFGQEPEDCLIAALDSGADTCIMRPFSVRQLLLRAESLYRRASTQVHLSATTDQRLLTVGDIVIDTAALEVTKNGAGVSLTPLEFRVLHCLAADADRVVTFANLVQYTWRTPSGGDAGLLKTHISHIRHKLASAGGHPVGIYALPGVGYLLSFEQRRPIGNSRERTEPRSGVALLTGGTAPRLTTTTAPLPA